MMTSSRRNLPLLAALVLAAGALVAGTRESAAAADSPITELRSSLHDLFSPPRRFRRAKSRRARAAAEAARAQRDTRVAHEDERATHRAHTGGASDARPRTAAVPLPPPRPPEAPPRTPRTASIAAKASPPVPRPRPSTAEPSREQSAAHAPPEKGAAGTPEASPEPAAPATPPPPSACQLRLAHEGAVQILAPVTSGQCTIQDAVRLEAVTTADGKRIPVAPAATLSCPMAETVIHYIRYEVTSVARELGSPLKSMSVDSSFECRSRNRIPGARLSEHGLGHAIDVRGFTLANGTFVGLTDTAVAHSARERLRQLACARFTTVLGPGSDGYHENHIHLDVAERHNGYRICQWDVRDPTVLAGVPLPPERPSSAPPRAGGTAKSGARE